MSAVARGRGQAPARRLLLGLALACAACAQQTPAPVAEPRPAVEASASVDRAVATTGDVLTFKVTVDHDPAYAVDVPEAGAQIQGFRILDVTRGEPSERGGRIVRELVYRLRADLVGSYILPSITVRYRPADAPEDEIAGAVETSEIFVEVESVLPADGSADDIREIKPLRPIERDRVWWIAALALAAFTLAALGLWYLRRRRALPAAAPLEPADERAFRELDALRATDFEDSAAVRRFYFQISEVVRSYVEGRFGLNATDLTTEEILVRLPTIAELAEADRAALGAFLEHTDRVKFAEHVPSSAEIQQTWEGALGFVEATRPRPEAAAEELAA